METAYRPNGGVNRRLMRWGCLALLLLVLFSDAHARQTTPFAGSLLTPPQQQQPHEEEEPDIKPSRPGVANSAEIPEPGVLQLELGYDSNFRARDVRAEHTLPVTLRYSAAKRLLLHLDFDAVRSMTDEQTRARPASATRASDSSRA
jgi:hypothetical protein